MVTIPKPASTLSPGRDRGRRGLRGRPDAGAVAGSRNPRGRGWEAVEGAQPGPQTPSPQDAATFRPRSAGAPRPSAPSPSGAKGCSFRGYRVRGPGLTGGEDDERLWSDVWDSVERAPEPGSWSPRRLVPPPEAEAGAAPGRAPPWELPCYQRRTPEQAKPAPLTPEALRNSAGSSA